MDPEHSLPRCFVVCRGCKHQVSIKNSSIMKMADKINDEKYKAVMAEEEKAERELAEYEALQKRISRDADIQNQGSSSSGPYPVPGRAVNMAPADPDDAFFRRKSPILQQVWATFEATQNATTPKAAQAPPP